MELDLFKKKNSEHLAGWERIEKKKNSVYDTLAWFLLDFIAVYVSF